MANRIATSVAFVMVSLGNIIATVRTKLYCRTLVMVFAIAEVAITVRASIVIALGNIVATNGAKLYCGIGFFKAGGKNSDVFGGTA